VTFIKDRYTDRGREYVRHKIATIGLSVGEQNIPNGFVLRAVCGLTDETCEIPVVEEYDYKLREAVDCELCIQP
jgi:hypothetical protein